MISGTGLTKQYGGITVLNKVTVHCNSSEICGLLGANGAGKTTLFKILLGLVTPDAGNISKVAQSVKSVGGIIEKPALYDYLSAADNVRIFCGIQGLPAHKAAIRDHLQRVGLPLDRNDPVANFSMGMKQRLGIAIALLNNPACLILDEPFTGLDPMGVVALRQLIKDLTNQFQLAVFLSSHMLDDLNILCNRLYVLSKGSIIREGNTHEIMHSCTHQYFITGENLGTAQAIKSWPHAITGNTADVQILPNQLSQLLTALMQENIQVTACVPQPDLVQLFEGGIV
ncbi:MAG: ABC transporter ATP-binding protein [Bacteroidetes bacterium]|nr:ABC transporter ATP-binding protein [Bacteroidota bacterium]